LSESGPHHVGDSATESRIAVITGTTHGIGRVTAQELADAGFGVVMLCRNLHAAAAVRDDISSSVPQAQVHVIHCDLASLGSVRACAGELRRRFTNIALLINNAGMVSTRHHRSVDGYELTFATNHLGPFLLTHLLLDRLAAGGRIINVASRAHYAGAMDFDANEARGARTTLYLALSAEPAQINGGYFDEHQRMQVASAAANDLGLQEQLWQMSARWTGVRSPAE
jgi:NAD(P)-dependent dehydrogenase (short-subunit alcohol dehydrogenase family)